MDTPTKQKLAVNAPFTPVWARQSSRLSNIKALTLSWVIVAVLLLAEYFVLPSSLNSPYISSYDPSNDGRWHFNATRDDRNLGLSEAQCDAAFPKLYDDLDTLRDRFGRVSISQDQLALFMENEPYPHTQVRVLIHNGQMYIIDEKRGACDIVRALAGLSNLYRAITALPNPRTLPNIEFTIDVEDTATDNAPPNRIVWAWTRRKGNNNTWLMPDFDGWAYPHVDPGSYISFRERLFMYEKPWEEKDARAVWRGSGYLNDLRKVLMNVTAGKEWADVVDMVVHPGNRLAMGSFCGYQFPVHTEGNSWSGRLRYLQNCASAVVIHDLVWEAHYYHLLVPNGPQQNYIPVRNDWSDLEEKIIHYRDNSGEGQRIAEESAAVFRDRYLTPAAEACYWRAMVRRWAEVQDFEPEAYYVEDVDGKKIMKQRGIDWELFIAPDPNFPYRLPEGTSQP